MSLTEVLKAPIIKSDFFKGLEEQVEREKGHKAKEKEIMPIGKAHVDIYKGKTKVLPFLLTLKIVW